MPNELDFLDEEKIVELPKESINEIQIKKVDDETNKYNFIVSSESIDRDGDILRVSGWDLKQYKKNPVVLFGHGHTGDLGLPIGRATKVWKDTSVEPKKLMMEMEFVPKEIYPFAGLIRDMVDKGFIKTGSVRFLPKEIKDIDPKDIPDGYTGLKGREYTKQEMIEYSVVTLPANPDCERLALKSKEIADANSKEIKEWLSKGMDEVIEEKQGRVLSKKNETTLRTAVNMLNELLKEVEVSETPEQGQEPKEDELRELFDIYETEVDAEIKNILEEE